MRLGMRLAGVLVGLLLAPGIMRAQQQEAPPEKPAMTHLRVDLVLAEYNGEKKISSLPYTIYVGVGDRYHDTPRQSIRMGVRVPIVTGEQRTGQGPAVGTQTNVVGSQTNYDSVGSDIDCQASAMTDGRYRLEVGINRSSIYSPEDGASQGEEIHVNGTQPILRSFDSHFEVGLHDGETAEGISATDPFNGHVLKVSVTIHVVK